MNEAIKACERDLLVRATVRVFRHFWLVEALVVFEAPAHGIWNLLVEVQNRRYGAILARHGYGVSGS